MGDANSKAEITDLKISLEGHGISGASDVFRDDVNLQFVRNGETHTIPIRKRIKKQAAMTQAFDSQKGFDDLEKDYGKERAEANYRQGKALKELFPQEIDVIQKLNDLKNPYVPKIGKVADDKLSYEMEYIWGKSVKSATYGGTNTETKLVIVDQALTAIESVMKDGFINLEYAPKNMITQIDNQTGKSTGVILLDFGLAYPIDENGNVEIDMDLLKQAKVRIRYDEDGPGLVPPEAVEATGKVTINAEKALVWSLATRLILDLLNREPIKDHKLFFSRCRDKNPDNRPTFKEFLEFYRSIPFDKSKVGPNLSAKQLEEMKNLLGRRDKEIYIDEEKLNKALKELP